MQRIFSGLTVSEAKYAQMQLELLALPSEDLIHGPLGEELHHGRWRCSVLECDQEMGEHRKLKPDGMRHIFFWDCCLSGNECSTRCEVV